MVVLLLSALGGCGAGSLTAEAPSPEVPVHPGWEGLGLPVGAGRVVFSDAEMLTVELPADSAPAAIGAPFREALVGAGFQVVSDTSSGDLVSVSLARGGEAVALAVVGSASAVTVSVTRLAPVEP